MVTWRQFHHHFVPKHKRENKNQHKQRVPREPKERNVKKKKH